MRRLDYLKLKIFLFIESLLWTLIDLTRSRRMGLTKRMHEKYKVPPAPDTDQEEEVIKNNGQEQ